MATHHPIKSRFILIFGLIITASIFGGCLMDGTETNPADAKAKDITQPSALRDNATQARPGVPAGCSKEWNANSQDSVLFCPDIRPPKAQ
jgi:hypothetical protein